MPGRRKPALAAKSISGLKYFRRLQPLLARLHDLGTDNDPAGNRQLHFDHYASLILLYFFLTVPEFGEGNFVNGRAEAV